MKFVNKQFLNDSADETGFIVVKAISDRYEDLTDYYAKNPCCNAEVQIGDCSRKVYIDYSVNKDTDLAKRIAKIDVLIDNLLALKEALPRTWEDAKTQSEKWLEENKDVEEEEQEIVTINNLGEGFTVR